MACVDQQFVVLGHRNNPQAFVGIERQQMMIVGHQEVATSYEGGLQNGIVIGIIGDDVTRRGWLDEIGATSNSLASQHGKSNWEVEILGQHSTHFVKNVRIHDNPPISTLSGLNELLRSLTARNRPASP